MSGRVDLEQIYSRIYAQADKVFPELELQPYKGGWAGARKLDGSKHSRKDKVVITNTVPFRILEQGGESVTYWDYVARKENITVRKEIYRKLSELAGLDHELGRDLKYPMQGVDEGVILLEAACAESDGFLEAALNFFLEEIKGDRAVAVREYLQSERKYSEDDISAMELGAIFTASNENLYDHLKTYFSFAIGEEKQRAKEALGLPSAVGKSHTLVIPLRCKGRLVSFSFRDINHSAQSTGAKYLNLAGFEKSKYLFNFPAGRIDGDLILVEGELDALAATAKGISNVAALKGSSSLSAAQLKLIKEANPKRVVLCFDNDKAGASATEKIKEQLQSEGFACAVVSLPEGYDPDSYIREKGADELFILLQDAKNNKIKGLDTSCTSFLDLEARIANRPDALKTGYASLDKDIRIPVGAITLIGGRPRHGKTTVMYNLLLSMAEVYRDKKFYFFSYEESEEAILLKILNRLTAIDLKYNYMSRYEGAITNLQIIERYIKAKHTDISEIEAGKAKLDSLLREGRIQIIDKPYTVEKLAEALTKASSGETIGAVFIDYIQRIGTDADLDLRASTAKVSDTLRNLAVSTGLPLIVGAQFSRAGVGRQSTTQTATKPALQALKESGNLEEDANLVLGVWNKAAEEGTAFSEAVDLEIDVLKARDGNPDAAVTLNFKRHLGIIEDMNQQTSKATRVSEGVVL